MNSARHENVAPAMPISTVSSHSIVRTVVGFAATMSAASTLPRAIVLR